MDGLREAFLILTIIGAVQVVAWGLAWFIMGELPIPSRDYRMWTCVAAVGLFALAVIWGVHRI